MNMRTRITGLGLLAGAFGLVLVLASWNSGIAATTGQSAQSGHSGEDDPAIHHALKSLREAHHELKEARHDFGGHREEALHAIDEAIKQLEVCLHNTHNGSGSSNNSTHSRQNSSHFSTGS